jgi:DNA-binding transcriptional regulator YhcF (GntR family)|tara:strand:- start:745 stop:1113 length:369 start_codon:yes stop_codon:yes gene_type:complete
MEYNDQRAIYLQIADMICEKVLTESWKGNDRIPSVRELASDFQVNPNTVMRTYSFLQQEEIIFNKRGIGYFLSEEAKQKTLDLKKQKFLEKELPQFINKLSMLGYRISDIQSLIKKKGNEDK